MYCNPVGDRACIDVRQLLAVQIIVRPVIVRAFESTIMCSVAIMVFDFKEQLVLDAARDAAKHFVHLFLLQQTPRVSSLKLAVCALSKPALVTKVQLQASNTISVPSD